MIDANLILPLLVALAVAVAGWWYSRRIGLDQAEQKLMGILRDQVASLESSRTTHERLTASQIADLERRLQVCEERWQKWTTRVGEN